jgi:tRNA threonylcarbamoyladenosine biosynthesis protein TsaE
MIDHSHPADDSETACPALPLANLAATENLGARLAETLKPGQVIYLRGDLGAGKTTLVRGLLRALGHAGNVKSPTYTLIEPYVVSRLDLYHFDFYRFSFPEEYLDAGLDEYFTGQGVCLVEWPDRAAPYLPAADLEISLEICRKEAGESREATLRALTEAGRSCLNALTATPLTPPPPAASS